ncbi:MAG: hypothetical protein HYZ81_06880 [Nitrospinae bacterium]|nr:hypothetical protein [Nitrospinota bacterium]
MERKKKQKAKSLTEEELLRNELEEFIKELKSPKGLLLMALLDEVLPQLQQIHETLQALNKELDEKLARLEKL